MAVALFTEKVLANSTITGQGSARKKEHNVEFNALDPKKLLAVKSA